MTSDTSFGSRKLFSNELISYADCDISFSKHFNANIGLHYNSFFTNKKSFSSFQPRTTLNYNIQTHLSMKVSYSFMQQNLHLLSNNGGGLPTDLWVPATEKTPPQYSNLYSFGVFYNLSYLNNIELSLETYYKDFENLIEFQEGVSFFSGANLWEEKIERNGKGKSYGVEFLVQKKSGRLSGWLAYTLSYNFRKFDNLNYNRWFPYKFDRRHNLIVVVNYILKKNIILSSNFIFNTENAITLPNGIYPSITGNFESIYNSNNPNIAINQVHANTYTYNGHNQDRMPKYHRLDFSARFIKEKKIGIREWVVSIYNIYSNMNPYFIYTNADKQGNLHLYKVSLFPIIPSLSYIRSF